MSELSAKPMGRERVLVTLPPDGIHPSLTHEPTRSLLTGGGVPDGHRLMRFGPLAETGGLPLRELLAGEFDPSAFDPAVLDPYVAELLVIGHLSVVEEGEEEEEVVMDGATGRVFVLYVDEESPEFTEVFPLAPSLAALVRLLDAVDELTEVRGRFAGLAARPGPRAVEEASDLFFALVEDEEWEGEWGSAGSPEEWDDDIPAFWRIPALIQPLSLIAGPGSGLLLDLPAAVLEEEFGESNIVRADPETLPPELEHEPTRHFLTRVGLPAKAVMFELRDPERLLLTLAEQSAHHRDDERMSQLHAVIGELPVDPGRLLCLGELIHDLVVLIDGRTGRIHSWRYGDDTLGLINADVSTLAFTLWLHRRELTIDEEERFAEEWYGPLAVAMVRTLASVDPVACRTLDDPEEWPYWKEAFHDEPGGVL
ncbi:SUKH-4 family immunity protein [Streptomyces sp. CAU 1734]|uniref:SUKH-4 family immunity protein n=1 Tax=Streptomyces sp. CAU 1734 TaxID=3140360 RepID=UPI003260A06A